jgi:SPP1 family predicted phage head-tail adaptor
MGSSKYRHRVTLQDKSSGADTDGFPTTADWAYVVTVWAEVKPLSLRAREYYQAAGIEAEKAVQVTIRYRPGVAENMRVLFGTHTYDIWAALDTEMKHVEWVLICREVTAGG